MNNVVWLSLRPETPARGYWDQYFFEIAFKGYNHSEQITNQKEAIVIIPGAYQAGLINEINQELSKLSKCAVIITSDEENNFPIEKLKHKNIRILTTYPTFKMENITWLPIGYPPQAKLIKKNNTKTIDWSFAGQVNHESRELMVENVKDIPNGELHISSGFAQGLGHKEYYELMEKSKIVLCPRGNISFDSFRLYEALEAGCIPIAEDIYFFNRMFNYPPFPLININGQLGEAKWGEAISIILNNYETYKKEVNKWWKETKINLFILLRSL